MKTNARIKIKNNLSDETRRSEKEREGGRGRRRGGKAETGRATAKWQLVKWQRQVVHFVNFNINIRKHTHRHTHGQTVRQTDTDLPP